MVTKTVSGATIFMKCNTMDILTFAKILFTCMILWKAVKIKENLDTTWKSYLGQAAVWLIMGVFLLKRTLKDHIDILHLPCLILITSIHHTIMELWTSCFLRLRCTKEQPSLMFKIDGVPLRFNISRAFFLWI